MTLTHEINSVLLEAAVARCVPTVQADKDSRVHVLACNAEHTLTQALRHVGPGDTLLVSGICQENVVIPAELHRITLDGRDAVRIRCGREPGNVQPSLSRSAAAFLSRNRQDRAGRLGRRQICRKHGDALVPRIRAFWLIEE